ncbi:MAG: 2-alkenal reductase [Acidobacteria bacterium]|nr:MAG: 2-alkenal reductase [Acidobacteriota bacterium]
MSRTTIDYGIDLGTTNSAIALLKGTDVEVIRDNEDFHYTPSVVYIDKNNALIVGRGAKERLDVDPGNAFAEFKLQMGTNTEYVFTRSGRRMRPEELSAEVIKSLKQDVRQKKGEDVQAAVITVPAAFELPQCEATKRAAELAGVTYSPLLQEPVAAALAYGFQSLSDRVFWLVYDFGGGTFDAAIIQVRDGVIQVVNHGGDNHLGGKLIDWAIVDQLLIPAVNSEYQLTDFRRGNSKWAGAIAKLKMAAEKAKIAVSRQEAAEIRIEFLCLDDRGEPVEFVYDLTRLEVARLAEPFILRSINICKNVLSEKGLGRDKVEKILVVGGPTHGAYLRERLADDREGLGIPIEFGIDPMTVVAQGAAIFAGTQRVVSTSSTPVAVGQFPIELEYKPVGSDSEPLVGGKVLSDGGHDFTGYTIEFINAEARPLWRSGKISLAPNGAFMTTLWAEKGRQNTFKIELSDRTGGIRETVPGSLFYTIGMAITDPPLTHSVGVAMANNEMDWFFRKGDPLPARKRSVQRQAFLVRRGQESDVIKIPVVEGDNDKADRNQLIGYLQISSTEIKRDVPAGSEIEVVIEIDQSRMVRAKAFIAVLDQEFEGVLKMGKKDPDPAELQREVEWARKRLEDVRERVYALDDSQAVPILERIDDERMLNEVETTLDAARVDKEAAHECESRLLKIKAEIDKLEDGIEIPNLIAEARQMIRWTEEVVNEHGDAADRQKLGLFLRELKAALETREPNARELKRKTEQMNSLRLRILTGQTDFWIGYLAYLEDHKDRMTNQTLATQLFNMGRKAINNDDEESLKSACRQLLQLLPDNEQEKARGYQGTTIK